MLNPIIFLFNIFGFEIFLAYALTIPGFKIIEHKELLYVLVMLTPVGIGYMWRLCREEQSKVNPVLKKAYKEWIDYLNEVVSLFCISSAISAAATSNPLLYSLCFIIVIISYSGYKYVAIRDKYYQKYARVTGCNDFSLYKRELKQAAIQESKKPESIFSATFYFLGFASLWFVFIFSDQFSNYRRILHHLFKY